MAQLELRLMGSFEASLNGKPITAFKSIKVRALLAYLTTEASQPHRREDLAARIWPDWPAQSALNNLRNALVDLRTNIGDRQAQPSFLLITPETLQLNRESDIQVDLWDFERSAGSKSTFSQLQEAISLYRGLFLEGFTLPDSSPFEEWLTVRREALKRQLVQALHRLAEYHEGQSEFELGLAYAYRQVEMEPWLEEAHQQIMRMLARRGQRSEALAQYEQCRKQLAAGLGVEPGNATRKMYADIRDGVLGGQPLAPIRVSPGGVKEELEKVRHNLPLQLTSFIGRVKELGELRRLLADERARLVTLTGSGGTGKTRLALQVSAQLLDAFPDGVWLVELAPLADPSLVPKTVIAALGQVEKPGNTPMAFLEDYLRSKQLLLILDNCEHLVAACAVLADALLHSAPRLTILASSREILGVAGEMPFHVPPLAMPDAHRLPPVEELVQFDAVRLFVERARVVSPGFVLTQENAAAVAQITQRLDGIPLAIELAAARLRLLSVGQIALRLNDDFRLLTGGSRTALPRHQTLQALIDWSYNLLSEAERGLLRSLSVFAGGWTLEAAEEVGGGLPDVLDLLGQLADKSLILAVQDAGGEKRYRMLETVRQYAHSRLVEAGEYEGVRTRHLVYYLRTAETLEPQIRGRQQVKILDYWDSELDNLRLALEWALQADIEAELRLAASLHWFWVLRTGGGIAWLEKGLAAEAAGRSDLPLTASRAMIRARALLALGGALAIALGAGFEGLQNPGLSTKANFYLAEALDLYRASGAEHRRGLAWTLVWSGRMKITEGDSVQAQVLLEEALGLCRASSDTLGIAECLQSLGWCEIDPVKQDTLYQEKLTIAEAEGDIAGIATVYQLIGWSKYVNGDYSDAYTALKAGKEHINQVFDPNWDVLLRVWIAKCSLHNGDLERTDQILEESLAVLRKNEEFDNDLFWCLFWKGMLALAQGRYEKVAELIDEMARIAKKTGSPSLFIDVIYHRARLARLSGDTAAAQQCAQEGLKVGRELGSEKMLLLLELGYLALQDGDLARASALLREGLQVLVHWRNMIDMNMILDGLAVLAVREHKMERAARLFGTRLWRGFAYALSPIERAERDADFTAITTALGAERFAQLRDEGFAMPFMQILALAQQDQ